jgi:diaminopimelate decarboxylase
MRHFDYQGGVLHAEAVSIPALADAVGTPFYCYSTATLERHYRVFTEAFAGEKVLVCYAMKANSNQSVLRTLAKLGAGADVVSGGELKRALAAGIAPDKILFSGIGKTAAELRAALTQDILCINVESEPELELLSAIATEIGRVARVSVRVNPDVDAGTHAKISTGKSENKFGIPLRHARAVYARAAQLPGIRVTGVDMHIGSQITDLGPLEAAFNLLVEFVRTLRSDGHVISHVDFGGGLGIPGRLCRHRQAGDAGPRLHADVRAGPDDRRQCRHPGHARRLCEAWRRQEFRHHRCRDERSDPADAV